MTKTVAERSPLMERLARPHSMIQALLGGTQEMRDAGSEFLPRFPNETLESWQTRLETATLFPAFRRTVAVMAGKPFSKSLTLSEDTPSEIVGWADDIDREGTNLHAFGAEMLTEALAFGLAGILVEAPKAIRTGGPPVTVAEVKAAGHRPYFVRVRHDQILGFQVGDVGGRRMMTQLRLKECHVEANGPFSERVVDYVRVLTPGAWALWGKIKGKNNSDIWIEQDRGTTGLDSIPFVPIYGERKGFMEGASPLADLAFLNVKHWQSQSDQDTILHVARVPILFMKGFEQDDEVSVGAASAIKTGNTAADVKYIEHTGAAISAGSASIAALEDQMIQAGAELLVKKPGRRSATESANDAEANKSDLQRITESFEGSLNQALFYMAKFAGLRYGGQARLFKAFGEATLSDASAALVANLWQAGGISHDTMVGELKRRGTISDEVNAEVERVKVEVDPPMGLMPPAPARETEDA